MFCSLAPVDARSPTSKRGESLSIIQLVNEAIDAGPCRDDVGISAAADLFGLERRDEAIRHGIVLRTVSPAHA